MFPCRTTKWCMNQIPCPKAMKRPVPKSGGQRVGQVENDAITCVKILEHVLDVSEPLAGRARGNLLRQLQTLRITQLESHQRYYAHHHHNHHHHLYGGVRLCKLGTSFPVFHVTVVLLCWLCKLGIVSGTLRVTLVDRCRMHPVVLMFAG